MANSVRSNDRVSGVYKTLCSSLDTPSSLACWLLYQTGEHKQLAEKKAEPSCYCHVPSMTALKLWKAGVRPEREVHLLHGDAGFEDDYLVISFLSKWKGLKTGIDLTATAIDAFESAEKSCTEANRRIREAQFDWSTKGTNQSVNAIMLMASRKITTLLGDLDYAAVFEHCKWGPGATYSLKGEESTLVDKVGEYPITVTALAAQYLRPVLRDDYLWASAMIAQDVVGPFDFVPGWCRVVEGCRVTTVPKNAKTDRTIAIEPTGNIFLQLGVGRYIRTRLKRVGIDLNDQRCNQRLARLGSRWGRLATIDLSAASDTVCTELVRALLPYEWFLLLDHIRSPKALMKGSWLNLEKFSSMGNGFTFELETLIFWALTSACSEVLGCRERVSVYGDDIVVASEAYTLLSEVLEQLGFQINRKKSYASGYFRESCGKHYWHGHDVTPVYQKELLQEDLPEVYRLANRLMRLALRRGGGVCLDGKLRGAWGMSLQGLRYQHAIPLSHPNRRARSVIPRETRERFKHLRPVEQTVPYSASVACSDDDRGVLLPADKLAGHPACVFRNGVYYCRVLSFSPCKKPVETPKQGQALLAYILRFTPNEPFNGQVSVRGTGRYSTQKKRAPYLNPPLDVKWAWMVP